MDYVMHDNNPAICREVQVRLKYSRSHRIPQRQPHHKATSFMVQPSVNDLNEFSQLIEAGQVKVYITDTLPLEEAQTALELSQQRDAGRRKVVLSIK
jgi:NADPH:quinone reductase-like Zn-dependent oxidoreductase